VCARAHHMHNDIAQDGVFSIYILIAEIKPRTRHREKKKRERERERERENNLLASSA